ncbi:LysR family transcriptional regulator [Acinetobacter seifertii]|uniref:LysR family transcriptional regulator n=1 Tax=Acinetobacter seifertii TaxID=1530123 RepID=UPI00168CF9F5|nr:LysR family transcriptional regulator [Acinetobacter seifertii]QNW93550.1 LysR family transcriptional regulator [Acinetobacter seifertii]QNX00626.1 LysR family transcriptional regulator [Acinetobacter seifertii]
MQPELSAISIFVTVVEAGSFVKAAEQLHLTRSAISKNIARLEEQLGVALFKRTTRSLTMTDEGALFYEHSRRAVSEIQNAAALLDQGKINATGRLRMSVPVLFGQVFAAPLMVKFAQQHVDLQLEISFNDRTVDLVEEGFDLCIRIGTLPDTTQLVAKPIGEHRMLLCASPNYLNENEAVPLEHIEDLDNHTTIADPHFGQIKKWRLQKENSEPLFIKPKAKLLLNDLQAIKNAALAGAGIAWLPDWLIQNELQDGTLVQVLETMSSTAFPIHLVWPTLPFMPLKTRLAIDYLAQHLPSKLNTQA